MITIKLLTSAEYSNIGENLATKKTPAVTIVAAWIRAETGVGPSIASGSQVCKPNCADLPIAPKKSIKQIKSIALNAYPKTIKVESNLFGIWVNISLKLIEPNK